LGWPTLLTGQQGLGQGLPRPVTDLIEQGDVSALLGGEFGDAISCHRYLPQRRANRFYHSRICPFCQRVVKAVIVQNPVTVLDILHFGECFTPSLAISPPQ